MVLMIETEEHMGKVGIIMLIPMRMRDREDIKMMKKIILILVLLVIGKEQTEVGTMIAIENRMSMIEIAMFVNEREGPMKKKEVAAIGTDQVIMTEITMMMEQLHIIVGRIIITNTNISYNDVSHEFLIVPLHF